MKYVLTPEKVEIYLFAKMPLILRMVAAGIIFIITLIMAITMPETAGLLYLLSFLSLFALWYAFFQSKQKVVFDLIKQTIAIPKGFATRIFDGQQVYGFQKVNAVGRADYYVMLLKTSELPTHARGDGLGFGLHRVCFASKV